MSNHKVPFYSQFNDIVMLDWKNQGCGVVSLKMLMDFWHSQDKKNTNPSIEELIQNRNGAFIENVGWSHSGLISIARQYGYDGFNKDFVLSGAESDYALEQLKNDLAYFPVMVSVWNKFNPENKGGHLVIVTDMDEKNVFINDPEEGDQKKGVKKLSTSDFIKAFKKRYIAIYPSGHISRSEKMKIFNVNMPRSYMAMIENSEGTKMFKNLYIGTPNGEKDILGNGDLSCSVFVSSVLYQWGLVTDTHANVNPTVNDMVSAGWFVVKEPQRGCVIEWEAKEMSDGKKHKHLGFYLGDNKAISNRPESGTPAIHHWTFGEKDGRPVRKIEKIYWNNKLNNNG